MNLTFNSWELNVIETLNLEIAAENVWITQVHQEAPVRSMRRVREGSDVTEPVVYIDPDIEQGPRAVLTSANIMKQKKKSHKVLRATWRKQHIHVSRSTTEHLVCPSVSPSERGLGPSVSEWRNAGDEMWSWRPGSEQWLTEVLRG